MTEATIIAATHQPNFLLLGVEVDFLARNDPDAFSSFVRLYEETYYKVKKVSPSTRISVTFQFESLKRMLEGIEQLCRLIHQ